MPRARSSSMLPSGVSCVQRQYSTATISMSAPGTNMASRQPSDCCTPRLTMAARISGITLCVTPPPALPQPPTVAFAVPTTFGGNMTEVWIWVMPKLAPMAPMARRNTRKLSYDVANAMPITGIAPSTRSAV